MVKDALLAGNEMSDPFKEGRFERVDVWEVVDEASREQWMLDPQESVGPLRFGMSHDEVATAVAGLLEPSYARRSRLGSVMISDFTRPNSLGAPAITVYYEAGLLACVAVNALRGPQVSLDGLRLVGQVPSQLEDAFDEYLSTHGHDLRYSQHADPGSEAVGVVLRAQRAGDVVLSRPVLVGSVWAERCGDVTEGPIPMEEWQDRQW